MRRVDHPLGPSQLGTARTLTSLHYGRPQGGRKAYLQASLHADELPGMLVMHHLMPLLAAAEAAGRVRGEVVLVPVANPIGLSQRLFHGGIGRFEANSAENFNRGYPDFMAALVPWIEGRLTADASANRDAIRAALVQHVDGLEAPTELAALRRTLSRLACDADVVLDLHCDHEAILHLYCEAPYWPQCEPLARLLGAETVLLAKNSGGASFDEAMGGVWWQLGEYVDHGTDARDPRPPGSVPIPLACLAVTVELRGQADVDHALAARDARALFDYLVLSGAIDPEDMPAVMLPPLRCEPTPLAASEDLVAPHAGVVAFVRKPGDRIAAGDVVADVIDPLSGRATPVAARYAGVLYARAIQRYAVPGATIARVAGRTPFRTGNLLSP